MAPSVGISYVAMVLLRLTQGKCLKGGQGVMLKAVLGDLLGDLLCEKEGKRGVKIGNMSRRKSIPALEKGRIKLTRQYQGLPGVGALMRRTRNLNAFVGW